MGDNILRNNNLVTLPSNSYNIQWTTFMLECILLLHISF